MTGATNMATRADRGGKQGRTGGNGLGLFALAAGAFVLGAAEFVMMGILPQTAQTLQVSIPTAGHVHLGIRDRRVRGHADARVRPQNPAAHT